MKMTLTTLQISHNLQLPWNHHDPRHSYPTTVSLTVSQRLRILQRITPRTMTRIAASLTEFCFGMIGRADIEGSKSDVARTGRSQATDGYSSLSKPSLRILFNILENEQRALEASMKDPTRRI
jgi:hypothetical protein